MTKFPQPPPPRRRSARLHGLVEAWRRARGAALKGRHGTIDAAAAARLRHRADAAAVRHLYAILLGRAVAPQDVEAKAGQPIDEIARELFGSAEFAQQVWPALKADAVDLPHGSTLSADDLDAAASWVHSALAVSAGGGQGESAPTWQTLMAALARILPNALGAVAGTDPETALAILSRGASVRPQSPADAAARQAGVKAFFRLVLGRDPEPGLDLASRARRVWTRELAALLQSEEFGANVLQPLCLGQALPHDKLTAEVPAEWLADAASFTQGAIDFTSYPASWRAVMARLLSDLTTRELPGFNLSDDPILKARAAYAVAVVSGETDPRLPRLSSAHLSAPRTVVLSFAEAIQGEGATVAVAGEPEGQAAHVTSLEDGTETISIVLPQSPQGQALYVTLSQDGDDEGDGALPAYPIELRLTPEAVQHHRTRLRALAWQTERPQLRREITNLLTRAPLSDAVRSLDVEARIWDGDRVGALAVLESEEASSPALNLVRARLEAQTLPDTPFADIPATDPPPTARPEVPLTPLVLRQDQSSEATGLSEVAYLAAGLEHRFVPPGQIARWLSTLPPEVQQQAITALRESETGLATLPVLSWLPAIALPLDPAQLIAVADIAARQGRRQTALAWLRRLATCAAVPSMQTARAADIAETLGSYDALSLASDWRGALQSIDPTPATIARLEQRLVERNPLRSRAKLDKALSELRQAAEAGLREDPQDSARAIAMAHALALGGEPDRAADLLAECHAREPSNADVLTEWMLHVERTDNPKKVCEIAAKRLALGYDENAALSDLRARRAVGEARAIPERVRSYGDAAGLLVRNEHPRNCFFLGEFTDALRAAEALLDEEPKSRPTRALAIAAAIELGALETAEHHVSYFDPGDDDVALMERDLFQYEISEQRARATATAPISSSVLAPLNRLFARYGCQPLALDGSKRFGLSALVGAAEEEPACLAPLDQSYGPAPLTEGPLVSVIMTSFNSAQYVETAIRSILDQSYTPIEMIVVDDASTDATPEILRRLERTHPQLRTILKPTNEGTYVSKNQALREARGTYVAFQDSDDWSHPDRIGKSVAALESNCDIVGLTTDWLRMTSDGQIVIKPGGQISHVCCISLVFRRETVLNRAGFFDSVRVEADHEYIRRIRLLFGRHAVARLRWPLLIGRAHAASLTADPAFGIKRTGFTEPRLDYQRAYRVWHEEIRSGDASGFLAFPLPERPFSAPPMILPHHLPSTAAGTPAEQDA